MLFCILMPFYELNEIVFARSKSIFIQFTAKQLIPYLSARCARARWVIVVEVCRVYDHHSLRRSIAHPDQSRTGLVRFWSKLTGVRSTIWAI